MHPTRGRLESNNRVRGAARIWPGIKCSPVVGIGARSPCPDVAIGEKLHGSEWKTVDEWSGPRGVGVSER